MLLLELNEFNYALVRRNAADLKLDALTKVLNWDRSVTTTDDRDESGFLEPWAQWVSVHTGAPCSTHGIKHLGDVPDLASAQLWEQLDAHNITTGIWGVMNGARRNASRCAFFLPDPWTFSEPAHPPALEPVLTLPRYLARNYLHVSKSHVAGLFGGFMSALVRTIGWHELLRSFWVLRDGFAQFGPRHLVFIAWFEYASSLAFLRLYREHKPDFALLFVNTIAHAQHHYWRDPDTGSREIAFALTVLDRLVAKVLDAVPESAPVIVTNALSQKNTNDETAWILYRQKDPLAFVRAAGLDPVSVEPLMTHDAHIVFRTQAETEAAFHALSAATVDDVPAFYVERNANDTKRLFYRLDFTNEISNDVTVRINGREMPFLEWFALVVKRTGRHIPTGVALTRGISLPKILQNHELCHMIVAHFTGRHSEAVPLPEQAAQLS